MWVQNALASGGYVNRWQDADTIVFTRGARLLAGINKRGSAVRPRVQTNWRNTELHDHSGHCPNVHTDDGTWVDLLISASSYVMMAPLQ